MAAPEVTAERPLRADARRNREAIIKAARHIFGRKGAEAQMDDVARRAGVGMGTVYRHFPTKDALIEALIADRFTQITKVAREGLEDPDPWAALRRSLWFGAELGARDRAITGMFSDRTEVITRARGELNEVTAELLRRAQAAGDARSDLEPEDIAVVMCGVMNAMHRTGGPDSWKRHLGLILDGMTAGCATHELGSG